MFKYKKSRLSAFFAAINIVLADIGGKKTTYIISFRAKSIIIMSISVVMLVACERHASTSEQMDTRRMLVCRRRNRNVKSPYKKKDLKR